MNKLTLEIVNEIRRCLLENHCKEYVDYMLGFLEREINKDALRLDAYDITCISYIGTTWKFRSDIDDASSRTDEPIRTTIDRVVKEGLKK